jgi:hypothetical protein
MSRSGSDSNVLMPTVALARQLAVAHPNSMLACPACPASVDAANLERHLAKVHATLLQGPPASGPLRLDGVDKRSFVVLMGLFVAWIVVTVVVFAVLKVPLTDASVAALGGSLLVCSGLPTAAALGVFKAHLELDDQRLRLRWLFGVASREVPLPAELETGTATDTRSKPPGLSGADQSSETVRFGSYLRLTGGGRSICVASPKLGGLGQRWAPGPWTRAGDRRYWDITLDRSALVALETRLAARGQLSPRPR